MLEGARSGHVWTQQLNTGRHLFDGPTINRDLRVVARKRPWRRPQAVLGVGVRLVAELDPCQPAPERRLRREGLALGCTRVVVSEADRQQYAPAALCGQLAKLPQRAHLQHRGCPRGGGRGCIGPGHTRIGRCAAESQYAGAERAQHRCELAMVSVASDRGQAGQLEEAEASRDRSTGMTQIDRDRSAGDLETPPRFALHP